MTKDEVLIVRYNLVVPKGYLEKARQEIMLQLKDGVVVLPYYMEPVIVPKDVEIRLEGGKKDAN